MPYMYRRKLRIQLEYSQDREQYRVCIPYTYRRKLRIQLEYSQDREQYRCAFLTRIAESYVFS